MKYFVSLDQGPDATAMVVDVTEKPSGDLVVSIDGKPIPVDVVALDGALSVRVAGRVVDLTTEGEPPEMGAIASGHRSYVRVESERQRAAALASKAGGGANEKVVKAPMPGRVVKMLVSKDMEIEQGQTLCVIEAMKMENEVKAKTAGRIADVHVAEGATVEGNAKLFSLA